MQFRLQARYTVTIVAVIICIVLVLSTVLLNQFESSTRRIAAEGTSSVAEDSLEQIEKRAAAMTTTLGNSLVNPLYFYNLDQIYSLLQAIKQEDAVLQAQVYDQRGYIVHDGSTIMRGYGKPSRDVELAIAAIKAHKVVNKTDGNELRVAYPIFLGEEMLGGVLVALSLDKMLEEVEQTRRHINRISEESLRRNTYTVAALTLVLAGLGALLSMVIASRLIRPIKQLATYAAQIGHGNYDVTFDIHRRDELGDLANALEEMRDNLRRSHEEIRFLAYHDRLTGLPNRTLFREFLDRTIERAHQQSESFALLFIDVDNFKRINDTFGHQAGDLALQTLAARISGCLRAADFLAASTDALPDAAAARLGGDEFIVLVPVPHNPLDAAGLARRILGQCEQPIPIEAKEVFISASIGIAIYPNDGATSTELVKHADLAMYHAKSEGKNTYKYFTEALNQRVQRSMELELELRKALERGEIHVYYQPQIDLLSGRVVGAEALARWLHPTRGLIMPTDFIPIAEDTGLIVALGEHVIREAARQANIWRDAEHPRFYVSVNVSSLQCRRHNLADTIERALRDSGAAPDSLHVELTESNLMKAEDQAKQQLDRIRASGTRVWLDDFGTGYSSLSYLRRFAVDGVKIDRSFIHNLCENEDDRALTRAVIAMAHSLKLGVIAEGVETAEQEAALKADGCRLVQGFRYGRAIPATDFKRLLADKLPRAI